MPSLRGHHLICLHFFSGEGYIDEFVRTLKEIKEAVDYHGVKVQHGADDVCRVCVHLVEGRCVYAPNADDEVGEMDHRALNLLCLSEGTTVAWKHIADLIPGVFETWYREYCSSCGWKSGCEKDGCYQDLVRSLVTKMKV